MTVEPRQAGETILCACGAPLAVPTLLEIVALEPAAEDVQERSPAEWDMHNRLVLLGSVIVGIAIVAILVLNIQRPVSRFGGIDPYQIWRSAQSMYPVQAWDAWQEMKKGLDRRTDDRYAAAMVRFYIWEGVVGGIALCGGALVAAGVILGKRRGRGAAEEPPPSA